MKFHLVLTDETGAVMLDDTGEAFSLALKAANDRIAVAAAGSMDEIASLQAAQMSRTIMEGLGIGGDDHDCANCDKEDCPQKRMEGRGHVGTNYRH